MSLIWNMFVYGKGSRYVLLPNCKIERSEMITMVFRQHNFKHANDYSFFRLRYI